jgi:hypothetical protein
MMKERPIIFNSDEVRAILEGRKTMMRRVVKGFALDWLDNAGFSPKFVADPDNYLCPYGQPGDRLWVKETTFNVEDHGYVGPVYLQSDRAAEIIDWGLAPSGDDPAEVDPEDVKLRPSIFMPKKYARIFLEVVGVRVERVQDISEEDAEREGSYLGRCACLPRLSDKSPIEKMFQQTYCHIHGQEFKSLWDSINAKRGYGWDTNPWVWVIEFKQVEATR